MIEMKIVRMGDPVLRLVSAPVADPTDPAISALAQAMTEAMLAAPGVGLAAPQVGQSLRMIVMRILADRSAAADEAEPARVMALINPEWEPLGPEMEMGWEGCLSVPDLRGMVPRFTRVGFRGWLLDGTRVEDEAQGFQARIIQHETDHLDGGLYLDRMKDFSTLGYTDEVQAALLAAAQKAEKAAL